MIAAKSPADLEIEQVFGSIRHRLLKVTGDWILKHPEVHAIQCGNVKNASDFLSEHSIAAFSSGSRSDKAAILVEAVRLSADCLERPLSIYGICALFVYMDCIARHMMSIGVVLNDAEASQLIGSYGRRIATRHFCYGAFSIRRNDVNLGRDGVHLFARAVAPAVRKKSGFWGKAKSAAAFKQLLELAELGNLDVECLAQLRCVVDSSNEIPTPVRYVPPPPPDPRRTRIWRPSNITEAVWEAAWKAYDDGERETVYSNVLAPEKEALWIIQCSLEPSLRPQITTELIHARIKASSAQAVWWHRTEPVHNRLDTTSYIGGLPRLDPALEWPRTRKDKLTLPLAAQIDCAQIPNIAGGELLPREGTLYFFLNVHVEDPRDDVWGHVLYSSRPARDLPITPAPDNPRLCFDADYDVSGGEPWVDAVRRPDLIPSTFHQWAIEPLVFESFLASSFHGINRLFPNSTGVDRVKNARDQPRAFETFKSIERQSLSTALNRALPEGQGCPSDTLTGYPWTWYFILIHATKIADNSRHQLGDLSHPNRFPGLDQEALEKLGPALRDIAEVADAWVREAETHDEALPVSQEDRMRFMQWSESLDGSLAFARACTRLRNYESQSIALSAARRGSRNLISTVSNWQELLPPEYTAITRYEADNAIFARHQMLGHGKDLQGQIEEMELEYILLMQLDTDYGLNWIWGDCGVVQFWIKPDDLKRRNFKAVKVTPVSG